MEGSGIFHRLKIENLRAVVASSFSLTNNPIISNRHIS